MPELWAKWRKRREVRVALAACVLLLAGFVGRAVYYTEYVRVLRLEYTLAKPPSVGTAKAAGGAPTNHFAKAADGLDDESKARWRDFFSVSLPSLRTSSDDASAFCLLLQQFEKNSMTPVSAEELLKGCADLLVNQAALDELKQQNAQKEARTEQLKADVARAVVATENAKEELRVANSEREILSGEIVSIENDRLYEVVIGRQGPPPPPLNNSVAERNAYEYQRMASPARPGFHALLITRDAVFTTHGRFSLLVRETGSRVVTLKSGLTENWPVYTESTATKIEAAQNQLKSAEDELERARRELSEIEFKDDQPLQTTIVASLAKVEALLKPPKAEEKGQTDDHAATAEVASEKAAPDTSPASACRTGDLESCNALANTYVAHKTVEYDMRARVLYERACAGQRAEACVALATMLIGGAGGPVDSPRGFRLLREHCARGDANACAALAVETKPAVTAPDPETLFEATPEPASPDIVAQPATPDDTECRADEECTGTEVCVRGKCAREPATTKPSPPKALTSPAPLKVKGPISSKAVYARLFRANRALLRCFESSDAHGRVDVVLEIAIGEVQETRITRDTTGAEKVTPCMMKTLKKGKYPVHEEATTVRSSWELQ